MSLYPFKFRSRFVEKIWGGRKIETVLGKPLPAGEADRRKLGTVRLPARRGGQIGRLGQRRDRQRPAGRADAALGGRRSSAATCTATCRSSAPHGQFPILIKFLDAREDLSLQVHPDQDYADTHPDAHLKSEAWYVVQNEPGAG